MKTEGSFFQRKIKPLLQHKVFSLILLYIAMVVIFTIWAAIKNGQWNSFLRITIFRNILNSLVISSFLTIGAGCLLIAGHMDLSQAAIGAFGSMVLATAIKAWGLPWFVGIILALLLCAIFGAVNAFFVTKLKFPSFIGTLAMASMVKGLMYLFSSMGNGGVAANINFSNKATAFLGTGSLGPIPLSVVIMVIFFIVYGLIMSKTAFGMKVTLMGGSPVAATLAGINAAGITTLLFINSAVLGGVAGISLYIRHLAASDPVTAEDVARHLLHYRALAPDAVGFGCDYDGADLPEGIADLSDLPAVADILRAKGLDDAAIEGIYYGNVLRFLEGAIH